MGDGRREREEQISYYVITNKGMMLDLEQTLDALMGYDVIFFGEDHDSRVAHDGEIVLFSGLAERDSGLVLALEMFECEVQSTLNAYLKETITEDPFLEQTRPWPNYKEDYRPLIELAKAKSIPVIAANIPRRAAKAVARADAISPDVLGADSIYLPSGIHLDSKEYYERFATSMKRMGHSGAMMAAGIDGLYKAQVFKDAVMAASLEPFLDHRIFFCCGRFHSDYHLGIPYQLQKNYPQLDIAVIVCAEAVIDLPMKERSRIADFIWVNEKTTPG